ncbi:ATP-binding cassette domain-containing protein [Corallococcus exiguus]|uniref:ABC-F family ATP-binding cassette domain-containing protein n=1 Tax=Corallococcus TaxID=83461 RepID=UPI000EA18A27|nr:MULTISPECIES: ATP-binding cassette domain-containing protein [Corallococcus]NNB84941.1 ATP-binding cassette domain-containing protein [Corallococcus exiguus]NNC16321.1 ATP-binding cassette domain-containing protein [Corallococcus exiguus]NRD53148.1 ATP-binding cassette domain-containing protein [Corallococcus exiguus]NRD61372.1 ATP-binding cassette domain-containing protein [Corallococcus exiguus]RKH26846.1 ATP-binding cassette domain-containing protein [Corallococcus sp. CA041A]
MFNVINVSKAYGPKKLFEEVNVAFSPGRRYGLTGPNGAGKSTFMKILAGDEEQDMGDIIRPRKLGILRQDHFRYESDRVIDVVLMGNRHLWAAMDEKNKLLAKADITEEDGNRLGELEGVIAEEDGYSAESDAATLLAGLGIEESFHEEPMRQLTGGLKLRVLLAQALFGKPEGLLLDEPTNNLDIDSIRWLENFLHVYEGVLITISHDRHFLNSICTHIADIDYETIIQYTGGYDDMVRQKSQLRTRVESETEEKKKKIAQLQDFVARFHAGTRASQVQSRIKQIDKLKTEDLKRSNIARPFIRFDQKVISGRQTLMFEGLKKSFDGVPVIKPFTGLVCKGERICVIGRNAVGKSTLVKMLANQLEPDAGTITWGHQATVGYLPQDHHGVIHKGTTCFGYLREISEKLTNEEISGVLGRMLFSGEERMKATDTLSGGETVRVLLSKLMITQDNVLILDEPTNHLDLESIAALAEGLSKFDGTVICVTHDQELISEVATRIWSLEAGKEVLDFNGPYSEFREKHADAALKRR